MFVFNENKKKYIEIEIFKLLELIEETSDLSYQKGNNIKFGSIDNKIPIDLTQYIVDAPLTISQPGHFGGLIRKKQCYKGRCIGFNEENYKKLKKLASTIYSEKTIQTKVTEDFIETKIFDWLIETYTSKTVKNIFTYYIISECEKAIKNYKFRFPILHLDISKPFQIGNVEFNFFTKEYFDELHKYHKNKPESKYDDGFEDARKSHQGKVFASFTVNAESDKAEQIAFTECALAVDILKMCSVTTDYPHIELGFDIDSRIKRNNQNEIFKSDANNELEGFTITVTRPPYHHTISDKEWEDIQARRLSKFHHFLISLKAEKTELELLIINSIKRYGIAISNTNIHQRVVELFTILESLLLPNTNSPIIESVTKYASKLITKKTEERQFIIKLLKSMYDIRSSLIHHGKEQKFELLDLRNLQITVVNLLIVLIDETKKFNNKRDILNKIEEAILEAY